MKKYIILTLLLAWGILASAQNEAEKVIKVQPKFEPRTELDRVANKDKDVIAIIYDDRFSDLFFAYGNMLGTTIFNTIILRNEKTGETGYGLKVKNAESHIYKYIDAEEIPEIIAFVKKVQETMLTAEKGATIKLKKTTKDLVELETVENYLSIDLGFMRVKKLDKFISYLERVQAYLAEEQKKDLEKSN